MSSEQFTFPSPIGGTPFAIDFAPSILFAVLYGLVIPIGIYRLTMPKSRTVLSSGTIGFTVEHVVIMALRASQARNEHQRISHSLTTYMQTSWGIGHLSMASDLVNLLRCLLVAATQPTPSSSSVLDGSPEEAYLMTERSSEEVATDEDNRQVERFWYRTICGYTSLFALVPIIIGSIAASQYVGAESDASKAKSVHTLRYVSTAMTLVFLLIIQGIATYGILYTRNLIKSSAFIIIALAAVLNVISVYRLSVLGFQTTSITSLEPGSLNSASSKATFYVFHLAPEWIVAVTLLGINVRERFKTGMWGDKLYEPLKKKEKK
ncbi:hypothetical protein QCA50_004285 [Cerrena zonata]|uniref:Uncharacterized protein n=1 Tax=Cerrena zonata TaxID=2478898 RepID=A0AAW0GRQ5_9APHY